MPTVKPKLRGYKTKEGEQTIYIRVSDAHKTRYISTGIKIKPKYWNQGKGKVRKNDFYDYETLNKIIRDKVTELKNQAYKLKEQGRAVNAEGLKRKAKAKELNGDYLEYAKVFADRKRRNNIQTGRRYDAIVSKIEEYTGGNLPFHQITVTWLRQYSDWLATERGNSPNTIHSNLRAIRAILYEAIREGLFPQEKNPFFQMTLKQPKVSRTKLNEAEIKKLSKQEPENEKQELAKQVFLFSFFTCGMRFRDICKLQHNNIEEGVIRYEMNKTGQSQSISLVPQAKAIIEFYSGGKPNPEEYVLPILDTSRELNNPKELDRNISSNNANLNQHLKEVAKKAKITKDISFHVARHSYADIARRKGMDLHAISNSLGHSGLKTTQNYLNKLDNETTGEQVQKIFEDL